jgi:hypothetical protein
MTAARVCGVCGGSLEGRRAGAKACGGKCRTAAWRQRKKLGLGDRAPSPSVTVRRPPVTVTAPLPTGPRPALNQRKHRGRPTPGPVNVDAELARLHKKFGEDGP